MWPLSVQSDRGGLAGLLSNLRQQVASVSVRRIQLGICAEFTERVFRNGNLTGLKSGFCQRNSIFRWSRAAYSRTEWAVEIPRADFRVLGASIARCENERLFSGINSIRIKAVPEEPEIQRVTLGLTRIVKE